MSNRISINNGFPEDGTLKFYLSPPDWGLAFERDLQDAGVTTDHLLEHSDTARDVLVLAVAFAGSGGIGQLARLLDVFLHRHDGKEFTIRNQVGDEISTAGFGVDDLERLLSAQLKDQRASDERWREFNRRVPPADSAPDTVKDPN
jgi:hypothetical protein